MTATSDQPRHGLIRIQRLRTFGWRLPPNTICVTRPGKWGNHYRIVKQGTLWGVMLDDRRGLPFATEAEARREATRLYSLGLSLSRINEAKTELRGHNIACYCREAPEGIQPYLWCHGDYLLDLANG